MVTVTSPNPGNVFVVREPVELKITSDTDGRLSYSLLDVEGRVLLRREEDLRAGQTHTLRPEIQETGWYELRWSLRVGGETSSGETPLAVVPRPSRQGSPRLGLDAVVSGQQDEDRQKKLAELARLTGVGMARDRLLWAALEPRRGEFVASRRYDLSIERQSRAGLSVYQVLSELPAWASSAPEGHPGAVHFPPEDLDRVYEFYRRAAKRYRGQVDVWEIWNEPDLSYFLGRAEDFAAVQKAGYLGVKAGNPEALVLFASIATGASPWLRRVLENGVCGYFDRYNVHFYGSPEALAERIREHEELMREAACRKPLWVSELGSSVQVVAGQDRPSIASARVQAQHLWRSLVTALSEGAERAFYFLLPHFAEQPGRPWGLLNDDLTPRPAYVALAVLSNVLGEARPLGTVELPGGGKGVVFDSGREDVMIAWSSSDEPVTFRVESLTIVDMMGRRRVERAQEGEVRLRLSEEPVALVDLPWRLPGEYTPLRLVRSGTAEDEGSPLWTSLRFNLPGPPPTPAAAERGKESLRHPISQPVNTTVGVHNYSKRDATVSVKLTVPAEWRVSPEGPVEVEVAAGETERIQFQVYGGGTIRSPQRVEVTAKTEKGRELPPAVGYVTLTDPPEGARDR